MKTKILLNIIIGLISISCFAQRERVENELMNCIYENYEDQGTKFRNAISDYEKLLIDEKILNDGTGKSYKAIFEKVIIDDEFNYNPSKSFFDKTTEIGLPQNESFKNCQSELLEKSENEYSKGVELKTVIDSIVNSGNISPSTIANGILTVLNEKDFELDYYKIIVFSLFDTINFTNDSGISKKLPEFKKDEREYDLSKALNIYIDGNNQIFVNKQKVDIEKFKVQIQEYIFKNKSKSIISFKTERETMYKTYINVKNTIVGEIQILREQLAKEKYNAEFDKLTEKQQSEIKKVYPIKIVE